MNRSPIGHVVPSRGRSRPQPRRWRRSVAVVMAIALSAVVGVAHPPSAEAAAPQAHTLTYKTRYPGTSLCILTKGITYYEPTTGTPPYPLALYVPGTAEPHTLPDIQEYLVHMANAGFVAASMDYDNSTWYPIDSVLQQKADCIFSESRASSAVSRLDALASVDVSKGIFVAGVSQGAAMSLLSKDYHPDVRGAWVVGAFDDSVPHLDSLHFTNTELEKIRMTQGQDDIFGTQYCSTIAAGNAEQAKHVTGVGYGSPCSEATSSPQNTTDVSWYVVPGQGHVSGVGFWNKDYPCSDPWSRCAVTSWAQSLVDP